MVSPLANPGVRLGFRRSLRRNRQEPEREGAQVGRAGGILDADEEGLGISHALIGCA